MSAVAIHREWSTWDDMSSMFTWICSKIWATCVHEFASCQSDACWMGQFAFFPSGILVLYRGYKGTQSTSSILHNIWRGDPGCFLIDSPNRNKSADHVCSMVCKRRMSIVEFPWKWCSCIAYANGFDPFDRAPYWMLAAHLFDSGKTRGDALMGI